MISPKQLKLRSSYLTHVSRVSPDNLNNLWKRDVARVTWQPSFLITWWRYAFSWVYSRLLLYMLKVLTQYAVLLCTDTDTATWYAVSVYRISVFVHLVYVQSMMWCVCRSWYSLDRRTRQSACGVCRRPRRVPMWSAPMTVLWWGSACMLLATTYSAAHQMLWAPITLLLHLLAVFLHVGSEYYEGRTAAAAPPPFILGYSALFGSHPIVVTP